jgi:major membrane immunogen (membrane-anchored lipoprotein)
LKVTALMLVAILVLGACGKGDNTSTRTIAHTSLHGEIDVLKDVFNADIGKVRAIFIASPT